MAVHKLFQKVEAEFDQELSRLEAAGSNEMSETAIECLATMRGLATLVAATNPPPDPNQNPHDQLLRMTKAMGLHPVSSS